MRKKKEGQQDGKMKEGRKEGPKKEGKRRREKLSLFKKCNRFLTLKDTSTKESEQ